MSMEGESAGQQQYVQPPGPRMTRLTKAMEHALHGVLKDCSYDKFVCSFPQLARDNPRALADARLETMRFFDSSAMEAFAQLVQERNIKSKLNDLDVLLEKVQASHTCTDSQLQAHKQSPATSRRPTPDQVATSYRFKLKKLERDRLTAKLVQATAHTETLLDRVEEKQKTIHDMMHKYREKKKALIPVPNVMFDLEGNLIPPSAESI
ncbi:hypothetical protein BASA50_001329 [Batrachochytrium salamandrivorans]|uniref:Outer kinetochore protein SPC19 n=1 Tax=Batrachochytrium salamandrivorans TaxID=1357716 RepID=A0ABQ8EVF6_9FUNG|nr:hypothetical protein BASA50_001329 [Batrachochytrium salamandrivorans]KAH9254784.1 hypothetical protein BASA81_007204 [Batrachochytrium salamandrivorans]KAH9275076.1 hypothetical protein BASA83_002297 [Batrachochytrium salamandrivorans]KAJ1345344.1 hypothetical protein BSLG_000857 [Batrachochytrium salamandrivorans]